MTYLVATTIIAVAAFCSGMVQTAAGPAHYSWANVTPAANFPQSYNYPVFVFGDWMVALNNGAWLSNDGSRWVKTNLADSGLNSAYQKYVQFNGAIYALGTMGGNIENLRLTTRISRTRDFQTWETMAESSNLPERVFYGAAVFKSKIWLVGGWDGKRYYNDVWNSADGVHWKRVTENAPWSPRTTDIIVFKNKLWLLGGGVIDGEPTNGNSFRELWTSDDGRVWSEVKEAKRKWRGTPIVFDGKLWLIGTNHHGAEIALWVSDNGVTWQEQSAPWSPRGAVAAWVFDGKLYMTGGKSSHTENGEIKFVYSRVL